jgi:hypothetical protein
LGEAEVLEEHPCGMGQALRHFAAEFGREVGDDFVEGGVGVAAVELGDEVLAEGLVGSHDG